MAKVFFTNPVKQPSKPDAIGVFVDNYHSTLVLNPLSIGPILPVVSRGINIEKASAPAVAAAMFSVDEHGLNLYLALVRQSPVTFTGPVFVSVPGAHKGGPFRLHSISGQFAEIEHITSGGIYDVHFSNIQIL